MSFKCQECGARVAPRIPQRGIVTKTFITSEGNSQIKEQKFVCGNCKIKLSVKEEKKIQ